MNKKNYILLTLIFIIGYVLRVLFFKDLSLTFGYDQARDALMAQEIINGDLKILGPSASTNGLYHGVLYFYSLVPGYLFSHNPIVAAYWIAFLNNLTIFIVFGLGYLLTRDIKSGLISAFLYAVSFEATQYAGWLSNPTLGMLTVPFMYLGLWGWLKEKKNWGAAITGLGLGLSVQAEIFLLYHLVPVLFWIFFNKKNIKKAEVFIFIGAFLLSTSTMLLSEIKFGFKGVLAIPQLLLAQDAIVVSKGLGDFVLLYLNQLGKVFAYSTYPGNIGYGGFFVLLLLVIAVFSKKKLEMSWQHFLATWLLSHSTVVSVGGISTPFLLVGIAPAVSLLIGIFISSWWKDKRIIAIVILFIITLANISMILKENKKGQVIFSIQKDMLLSKQLKAIDYTYESSNKEEFSVNSLTSPLNINIVWSYLYNWYGSEKYGYTPEWHGQDQVGQLSALNKKSVDTKNLYVILEPLAGIPPEYLPLKIGEEDSRGILLEEKNFGEIVVQKRIAK